jgi:VRR-NUC domain
MLYAMETPSQTLDTIGAAAAAALAPALAIGSPLRSQNVLEPQGVQLVVVSLSDDEEAGTGRISPWGADMSRRRRSEGRVKKRPRRAVELDTPRKVYADECIDLDGDANDVRPFAAGIDDDDDSADVEALINPPIRPALHARLESTQQEPNSSLVQQPRCSQHSPSEVSSPSCSPPVSPPRYDCVDEGNEREDSMLAANRRIICLVDDFGPDPGMSQSQSQSQSQCQEVDDIAVTDLAARKLPILERSGKPPLFGSSSAGPSRDSQVVDLDLLMESDVAVDVDQHDALGLADKEHYAEEVGSEYGILKTTYHMRAFDYVIVEVLRRYEHILKDSNVRLAKLFASVDVSPNAKSLFVRLYRRKPSWHALAPLAASYKDIDVPAAIRELKVHGLIVSSMDVVGDCERRKRAKDLLYAMNLEEMRSVCGVLSDCKKRKAWSRQALLPVLLRALDDDEDGERLEHLPSEGKGKPRQMTIDGSSPARNLVRAVLKAERVTVPPFIANQLNRIHFLFFFEDGHDSPAIILADTGKCRFPSYECISTAAPFLSKRAFEDYEIARSVERTVGRLVDEKMWIGALDHGSVAELEITAYMRICHTPVTVRDGEGGDSLGSSGWGSRTASALAPLSRIHEPRFHAETEKQLKHPFYRRYTATWVYALALWRSVNALERQKEYVTAVSRLELLLFSKLLPSRRAKFVDRLSINLMHLKREQDSLDVICRALSTADEYCLHRGDIAVLAKRGAKLHQRLRKSIELDAVPSSIKAKTQRLKAASEAVVKNQPIAVSSALRSLHSKIPVRKLRGKSLPSGTGRPAPPIRARDLSRSSWGSQPPSQADYDAIDGDSRDVGVKSMFIGLAENSLCVGVEELALEWFKAYSQWSGVHDEGKAVRFIWCLLFWDCAIYAPVSDVFQTPFQTAPWDLRTEAFYPSRKASIDSKLAEIRLMTPTDIAAAVRESYMDEAHNGVLCAGGSWDTFSEDDLSCIAEGLGGVAVAHVCELLCRDYAYWAGGLPDLVLWKRAGGGGPAETKLVEVKSLQMARVQIVRFSKL